MTTVLLIIHLFVTLALIGVVLIQRSEGGGLGVGTSQGMGSFMSGRGTANLLTRTTAILGTAFFVLSLALALLNRGTTVNGGRSILDVPAARVLPATPTAPAAPATSPQTPGPAATESTTPAPATPAPTAPAAPATTAPAPQTPSAPVTPAPNTAKP
jgi:preprotein translocase subunit SecG